MRLHGPACYDLLPTSDDATTRTTVSFRPDAALSALGLVSVPELVQLTVTAWPHLTVEVVDERVI